MKLAAFLKVGLVCIFATVAQAQTNQSTTRFQFPSDRFKLSYFGDMTVPASKADGSEWFHEPGFSYRISSVSLRFKMAITQYFARSERREDLVEVGDPTIGISKSNLLKADNFNLYGGLNLSPATSEYSQKKQRVAALGMTLIPSLNLGTRNLKLDWMSSLKYYFYESDDNLTEQNRKDLDRGRMSQYKAEFRPALIYKFNDRLDALLGGHLVFNQSRGRDLSEWARTRNALHLGANYEIVRSLSIRPELRLPDPEKWNISSVEAGMLFFASL